MKELGWVLEQTHGEPELLHPLHLAILNGSIPWFTFLLEVATQLDIAEELADVGLSPSKRSTAHFIVSPLSRCLQATDMILIVRELL